MPTHTPSPHRFLASHPSSASKPKSHPKPPSGLRHGFTSQASTPNPPFSVQTQRVTPAKRFVIAPARSASDRTQGKEDETWGDGYAQAQQMPRPKLVTFRRVESIDEGSPSSSPLERNDEGGVADSPEQGLMLERPQGEGNSEENENDEDEEMLFAPQDMARDGNKRRRLSPAELSSPTQPRPAISTSILQQHPQTATPSLHPYRSHASALYVPQRPSTSTSNLVPTTSSTTTAVTSRPHFLLPPLPKSPQKPATPLPETFSPSRKGQKYIPNGLASTLQGWIVETANTGYAAQMRDTVVRDREKDDGVKIRVRVSSMESGSRGSEDQGSEGVECYPGGVVFVSGESEQRAVATYNVSRSSSLAPSTKSDDGVVRIMLAGQGGARGAGGVRVRVGSLLGVRAPVWDVDVGGEKWIVGVDWVVL